MPKGSLQAAAAQVFMLPLLAAAAAPVAAVGHCRRCHRCCCLHCCCCCWQCGTAVPASRERCSALQLQVVLLAYIMLTIKLWPFACGEDNWLQLASLSGEVVWVGSGLLLWSLD